MTPGTQHCILSYHEMRFFYTSLLSLLTVVFSVPHPMDAAQPATAPTFKVIFFGELDVDISGDSENIGGPVGTRLNVVLNGHVASLASSS